MTTLTTTFAQPPSQNQAAAGFDDDFAADDLALASVPGTQMLAVDQMVPGANLAAYMQAVGRVPILTPEREHMLAEKL
ncbi:MAG: RNA polymerase sigma factor RpoH, partial [Congregibacter sp.]|nr:RNA polymerase sigma factor RpoH [Congregibacter sp.]